MKLIANAKINFTLDIKGKREDGYHLIDSVMQSVSLADIVTVEKSHSITVSCSDGEITGENNIAFKAASEFFQFAKIKGGADIFIQKQIPKAAGLGGGSADAAAVIVGLNELYKTRLSEKELCEIGLRVGADVPFCIVGGTKRATGIGEVLETLPDFPEVNLIIVKNGQKLSTKAMYEKIDSVGISGSCTEEFIQNHLKGDSISALKSVGNDFGEVCKIDNMVELSKEFSPMAVGLSGSGPSVFFVLKDEKAALELSEKLSELGFEPHIAKTRNFGIRIVE